MKKNSFLAFLFSLVLMIGIGVLGCNEAFAANIGDRVTVPEEGWKRYDDTNENIVYSSNFIPTHNTSREYYNNNNHLCASEKGVIKFSFYGTKLRLYEHIYSNRRSNNKISLDGGKTFESFSSYGSDTPKAQILYYEKAGLNEGVHEVIIESFEEGDKCFAFDCFDIDSGGKLLPYYQTILNVEPEKEKIYLNEEVTANIVIDNIKEIAAEDMIIKYDSEKLEFLGADEIQGIKVVKEDESEGQLRVILASQGKDNIANDKKILLKLNFKGIAEGEALVDIIKGKISDGIEMERDLREEECGQAIITIDSFKDPSKNGEFTLLDLAIDGRHYGENPADLPQYKTDVVENGAIDDDDLIKIGEYMLQNSNYVL